MSTNHLIPAAEALDIVVLGAFNPAIFHPEWFLRQKLISEAEANSSDTNINVVGKDVAEINLSGMKIFCMNDRFSIGTSNISQAARMQDFLLQTFTTLSHVPVTACGINPQAHYRVKDESFWHKIGDTLAPKDLIWRDLVEQPGMQSLMIKALRKGEFEGETLLWVEPSQDKRFHPGIFVRANYSHTFSKESLHAQSTELLTKFLKTEWDSACSMARIVAEKIFDKIKPDNA
jgi:hypothetical protein